MRNDLVNSNDIKKYFIKCLITTIFLMLIFTSGVFSKSLISKNDLDKTEIEVKTNKSKYTFTEEIKISFINNTKDSVFSHIGSHTPIFAIEFIEKKYCNRNWKQYFTRCQFPKCFIDSDIPVLVKPYETVSIKWKPIIYIRGTMKTKKVKLGTYRILIKYLNSSRTKWKNIYTNEFTIN